MATEDNSILVVTSGLFIGSIAIWTYLRNYFYEPTVALTDTASVSTASMVTPCLPTFLIEMRSTRGNYYQPAESRSQRRATLNAARNAAIRTSQAAAQNSSSTTAMTAQQLDRQRRIANRLRRQEFAKNHPNRHHNS